MAWLVDVQPSPVFLTAGDPDVRGAFAQGKPAGHERVAMPVRHTAEVPA
jgi:hypothetical protein